MSNVASPEIQQAMMYFYWDRKLLVEDHIRIISLGIAESIHDLSYYPRYRPLLPDITEEECIRRVEEAFTVGFVLRSEKDVLENPSVYGRASMRYMGDPVARDKARKEMSKRYARVTNHFDDVTRLHAAALVFGYGIDDVLALEPHEVSTAFDIILKMNSQPPWSFILTCLAEDIDSALAVTLWTGQVLAE
jgi:hypothetical protein